MRKRIDHLLYLGVATKEAKGQQSFKADLQHFARIFFLFPQKITTLVDLKLKLKVTNFG
jgi:hypothetical protein